MPSLSDQMRDVNMAIWTGKTDLALKRVNAILADHPDWEWAFERRGEAWRLAGDLERAAADFSMAIQLKSANHTAFWGRCKVRAQLKQIEEAIADCDAAAALKPDGGPILLAADLVRAKGDMAAAFDRYHRAAEVWPSNGATRFYSGQIALWYLDRADEAATDLTIAVKEAFSYRDMGGMFGPQMIEGQPVTDIMAPSHAFVPDALYAILWKYIAVAQTGDDAAAGIAEDFKELSSPIFRKLVLTKFENVLGDVREQTLAPWPAPIIGVYAGLLSEDALRRRLEDAEPGTRAHMTCDVALYLAEFHRVKGETGLGRERYGEALGRCEGGSAEHGFAERRLVLLRSGQ
jgi:tetratricopeptide (TPR) repeat protein